MGKMVPAVLISRGLLSIAVAVAVSVSVCASASASASEGSRGASSDPNCRGSSYCPPCSLLPTPICNCGKPGQGLCYSCAACGKCTDCGHCKRCKQDGPPPPPLPPASACTDVVPPHDWAPGVARGDVLFSACVVGAFNSPNVGNGFIAFKTGPNCDGTASACKQITH